MESKYNKFTLGRNYSVHEGKHRLIIEIARAEGSMVYLIGALIAFIPLVGLIINFIISSYNPFAMRFIIFPVDFLFFIFLFLSGSYLLDLYLNHNYFHRTSKVIFDKTQQKITHQNIPPKDKKDDVFEVKNLKSIVYHRDKINLFYDIIKLRLSFENGHSHRIIKVRFPHFVHGSRTLGKMIAEFVDKPFVSETSWKLAAIEGNASLALAIYALAEVTFRWPSLILINSVGITILTIVASLFNIMYLQRKTTSTLVREGFQIKPESDMLMDSKIRK